MRRLLFAFIGTASLFLFGLVVVASMVGAREQPPISMEGFADICANKPTPCWNGIVPGFTKVDEATRHLLQMGYEAGIVNDALNYHYFYSERLTPGCVRIRYLEYDTLVSYLQLYCMAGIKLGDVMSVLGAPASIVYHASPFGDSEYLAYDAQRGRSGITIVVGSDWSSLYRPITSIDLFRGEVMGGADTLNLGWHGFTTMWRYCQLEPRYPRC